MVCLQLLLKSLVKIRVVQLHKLEIQNTLPTVRHPLLSLTISADKNMGPFTQFTIIMLTNGHSLSRNLTLLQLSIRSTSLDCDFLDNQITWGKLSWS
jgi:pseudouridine-5'-phosphate glycosidase